MDMQGMGRASSLSSTRVVVVQKTKRNQVKWPFIGLWPRLGNMGIAPPVWAPPDELHHNTGNSERDKMKSVPNHGVASGAGSTTSTQGPRQEGGNSYYALAKSPLSMSIGYLLLTLFLLIFTRYGLETEQGGRINLPKSDSLGHNAKAVASIQEHTH
ncbi:hypothetical protein NQZ68_025815 [Dissostichus eleginoides]|nr:hypothetical protein NQZ68_025815 [Dissostichus eleginoides]